MRIVCRLEAQKRLTVVPGTRVRQPGEERRAAGEVHPLALLREPAADHHVDDVGRVEARHLVDGGADDERDEVVGAGVDERALARAPDRRARRGCDDGFGHHARAYPGRSALRSALAVSSCASPAASSSPTSEKKPCTMPSNRTSSVGTPAASRRPA